MIRTYRGKPAVSGSHSGCHGYKWSHIQLTMFTVRTERCWDLWEVGAEAKERYFVTDTTCVLWEIWTEAEEIVEHRIYNATQNNQILAFIHSVFCLTTSPKPPLKRFLHIVRSRASCFKWQYPLLFLRSSSSFLRLLPRHLVTSISPFIFPSITCFRRQFLRKMWPIQLAFRFLISYRIFLCSLTLSNTSSFRVNEQRNILHEIRKRKASITLLKQG